ncbi:hypothetical protein M427DRAFT_56755 [Gonapodya prolifera JEL478]|uniref:Uncharacterized protein n=1 Tax=Gonapodya prolifera (strain JEL478) TaxID=1344416 RepID=A0A139AFD3_GONPJ|nr:hypothetical protein M427DRAFT_56755 [Gonapodya prolifera JEL478]|eukprot:KXS15399.1 hypothetical protein M427DRAFT_56755 [Gonapodya prolifera JEL478]
MFAVPSIPLHQTDPMRGPDDILQRLMDTIPADGDAARAAEDDGVQHGGLSIPRHMIRLGNTAIPLTRIAPAAPATDMDRGLLSMRFSARPFSSHPGHRGPDGLYSDPDDSASEPDSDGSLFGAVEFDVLNPRFVPPAASTGPLDIMAPYRVGSHPILGELSRNRMKRQQARWAAYLRRSDLLDWVRRQGRDGGREHELLWETDEWGRSIANRNGDFFGEIQGDYEGEGSDAESEDGEDGEDERVDAVAHHHLAPPVQQILQVLSEVRQAMEASLAPGNGRT